MTITALFIMGSVAILLIGAVNSFAAELFPIRRAPEKPLFALSQLHYLFFGFAIFTACAACYHWLTTSTSQPPDERLGKLSFWLMFIGFNIAFFPTWLRSGTPALLTEPVRLLSGSTGPEASVGVCGFAVGALMSIWNFVLALRASPRLKE